MEALELDFNNLTITNTTDSQEISRCGNVVVTVLFVLLIMIVAFLGNSLVIGSSLLDPEIRRGGLLPMVTLAATDLIFAEVSCTVIMVSLLCPACVLSGMLCSWLGILELLLVICIMYQHAFMAVTRYVAVCHAVKYKIWFNTRNVLWILFCLLLTSMILAVFPSVFPNMRQPSVQHLFDPSLLICIFKPTFINIIYTSVLYFSTPVCVGTYCYASCLHRLKQKTSKANTHTAGGGQQQATSAPSRQQHRLVLTMLISYCIVLVTSVPLPLTIMAYQTEQCNLFKRHICWMIMFNSCVNPIVYAVKSSKFRKMFLRQLGCKNFHVKNHVRPESTMM